jgi:pimeloyl-ACP methyl ester carboxylesterase
MDNIDKLDSTSSDLPALVFIHGFLDGAAAWDEVVKALGDRAAGALCVDLPGMGGRVDVEGPYSLDRFVEDVATQVGTLTRPIIVVGQSMGAQIAELVAARFQERVSGLILITPVPLQGAGLPDDVMKTFHALGGDPGAQRDLRRQLSVNLDDVRLEKLGRLGDRVVPSSVGLFADIWNRGHELGSQHTAYNGPVLIVRGGDDAFVTEEIVYHSVIPRFTNPTVVSVDGAGHWPHVEQPQAVATILDAFLTNLELTASTKVQGQGWARAWEQKSANTFREAFASDVILEASIMSRPVAGAEQVKNVLEAASKIYEALTFTHEATLGPRQYLEWEARAFGGERLLGITILTKNEDGKIVHAAIHHRSLGSVLKFSAELGRRLYGKVDDSLFYSQT